MTFIEFIGFIVTILALFFLLIRKSWEERKRRENPEIYEEEEKDREKALREFLRSLNVEVEETETELEEPPPPEPIAPPSPQVQETGIEDSPYDLLGPSASSWRVVGKGEKTRADKILEKLDQRRDILVFREILGKPKALQTHMLPHDLSE